MTAPQSTSPSAADTKSPALHVVAAVAVSTKQAERQQGQEKPKKHREFPVPLTVLAELLGRHKTTPYRADEKFGLVPWLHAQVRTQLALGAWYARELDLEATIRFNQEKLCIHGTFVLERRRTHVGRPLDGDALCDVIGMPAKYRDSNFFGAWSGFIGWIADTLIAACREGHLEDAEWRDAERFLDQRVGPGVRRLRTYDPDADELPAFGRGGYRRFKRLVDEVTSNDPERQRAALGSWDMLQMRHPDVPLPQPCERELVALQRKAFRDATLRPGQDWPAAF